MVGYESCSGTGTGTNFWSGTGTDTISVTSSDYGVSSCSGTSTSVRSYRYGTASCSNEISFYKSDLWLDMEGNSIYKCDGLRWYGNTTASVTHTDYTDFDRTDCSSNYLDNGYFNQTIRYQLRNHRARLSPQERLLQIIQDRQAPAIHTSRKSVSVLEDHRELRARETLRMVIGEEKYRKFLKSGFVAATNQKSGYTYQIFHANNHLTNVYQDGKMVASFCIYLSGDFPPTDFVITMYLLALNNDKRIWEVGNKRHPQQLERSQKIIADPKTLVEIYKELKGAA